MAEQRIIGFHQDEEHQWVAELECGHALHVRHSPPWQVRPWVLNPEERESRIGMRLPCRRCAEASEPERVRQLLVQAAVAAYEDAALRGLCAEGAWEAAVSALRQVDLSEALRRPAVSPINSYPGY